MKLGYFTVLLMFILPGCSEQAINNIKFNYDEVIEVQITKDRDTTTIKDLKKVESITTLIKNNLINMTMPNTTYPTPEITVTLKGQREILYVFVGNNWLGTREEGTTVNNSILGEIERIFN